MLWACVHFPDFCLQVQRGSSNRRPFAVTTDDRQRQVLACNAAARERGIEPGMAASAALALVPNLIERPCDPVQELQVMEDIALDMKHFTPSISLALPDALLLEIGGCLKLFGGLRRLHEQLQATLKKRRYAGTICVAPTPTTARLLARGGVGTILTRQTEIRSTLSDLPLRLLDQPVETVRLLASMGVRTIGQCLALPRDGLARRFGQDLIDELDRVTGKFPDPHIPFIAPVCYQASLALPAPVENVEPLLFALHRLVLDLSSFLLLRGLGVTRLRLELQHRHRVSEAELGFAAACRDPNRILLLMRERLAGITLVEPVEALTLRSDEIQPFEARNLTLLPEDHPSVEQRWRVIEHLRARLGNGNVHGVEVYPDYRPERAWRRCEPAAAGSLPFAQPRPLWLLEQPQVILEEAQSQSTPGQSFDLLTGPQRIESGWWDEKGVWRDYFIVSNRQQELLWIFRERASPHHWFLHGFFA